MNTLFDLEPAESPLSAKIKEMHAVFGATPGRTCGHCIHLRRYRQGATWFKCARANHTAGAATDWRARWPACGLYEERKACAE